MNGRQLTATGEVAGQPAIYSAIQPFSHQPDGGQSLNTMKRTIRRGLGQSGLLLVAGRRIIETESEREREREHHHHR